MFISSFGDHDPWGGGITNLRHHSAVSPVCQGQPATVFCNFQMERACHGAGLHKNFHRFKVLGFLIHIHFIHVYLATEYWVLKVHTVLT